MHLSTQLANMAETTRFEMGEKPDLNAARCVTMWRFFHQMGALEHTNDWDWWIRVGLRDGRERYFDCGSDILGLATTVNPVHLADPQTDDLWIKVYDTDEAPYIAMVIEDPNCDKIFVRLDAIDHIVIGYEG